MYSQIDNIVKCVMCGGCSCREGVLGKGTTSATMVVLRNTTFGTVVLNSLLIWLQENRMSELSNLRTLASWPLTDCTNMVNVPFIYIFWGHVLLPIYSMPSYCISPHFLEEYQVINTVLLLYSSKTKGVSYLLVD